MEHSVTPTVWIVDDDEDDQRLIREAFLNEQPKIEVHALHDGSELMCALAQCVELPRLILLDVNMPVKNGFEALGELRSNVKFADLPIIMLTTSSNESDRRRSSELGANGFFTKPIHYNQLTALVQTLSQQWNLV